MKIIQVTDTHLTETGGRIHGLNPLYELNRCISKINVDHADADLCVLTGDLTSGGPVEAYRALRECLKRLELPYMLLIGNHDSRPNFSKIFSDLPHDENGFIQSVMKTDVGYFLFLDTNLAESDAGHYCRERQAWLDARLKEAKDQSVYIFMHHPPGDTGLPGIDDRRFVDGDLLHESLSRHNDIRYMFCGHVHKTISGNWRGYPYSAIRGTNHGTSYDWAGEPMEEVHEVPQYAVIYLNENSTFVHVQEYLTSEELSERILSFKT